MDSNQHKYRPNFSWAIFLSGVLISAFIGGGVKSIYLSDYRADLEINRALRIAFPNHQVVVQGGHFDLSSNLVPKLSLGIQSLRLIPFDDCANPYQVKIDNIILPLAFWKSLEQRKVLIDSIVGEGVHFKKVMCSKINVEVPTEEAVSLQLGHPEKDLKSAISETELSEILVRELTYESDGKLVKIVNLEASRDNDEVEYNFQMHVDKYSNQLKDVKPLRVFGSLIDNELKFNITGRVKEGSFTLIGDRLDNDLKVNAKIFNVPVTEALSMTFFPEDSQLKKIPLWMDCDLNILAKSNKMESVETVNCQLKSLGSRVQTQNLKVRYANGNVSFDKFKVNVSKVSLNQLLSLMEYQGLNGVFSDLGTLSGTIDAQSVDDWEFQYNVKKSKMYFSKKGIPGYQWVESLDGRMSVKEDRVSAIIDNVDLEGGDFDGNISFNFDKKFSEGLAQFSVNKLRFHPDIQKLLTGKLLGTASIFGRGFFEGGKLKGWTGDWKLSHLESEWIRIDDLSFKSKLEKGIDVTLTIVQAQITDVTDDFEKLKDHLGLKKLLFKNLTGGMTLTPDFQQLSFLILADEGALLFKGGAKGTKFNFDIIKNKKRLAHVEVFGKKYSIELFSQNKSQFLEGELSFANKSNLGKLKEFGKKALSRAKEVAN